MNFKRIITILSFVILTRGGFGFSCLASEPSATSSSPAAAENITPVAPPLPFGTVEATNALPYSIGESELKDLLTAALQRDYVRDLGELDLTLGRPWTSIMATNAPVRLKVLEVPTVGVSSGFIVRFELKAGNDSFGTFQMPVSARVWRDVWVAHSSLRRGEPFIDA